MLFHAESVHSAFLSTPSARRATAYGLNLLDVTQISIHALREEGDWMPAAWPPIISRFLSTPSARRATWPQRTSAKRHSDFYPRPPRGGRRVTNAIYQQTVQFLSTPSARRATEQRSPKPQVAGLIPAGFLSTPSARRATGIKTTGSKKDILISIHALREEGDRYCLENGTALLHFYPRPPRGGRPDCFNPAKR